MIDGRIICSPDLQSGQQYLIYIVVGSGGGLRTSRCLGTRPAADAESAFA